MNSKLKKVLCGVLCFVMLCCQMFGATVFAAEESDSDEVTITRIAGKGRSDTAEMAADVLKTQLGAAKFDSIIIASGLNFADALAGSYLAAVKSAPILLYSGTATIATNESYIVENLSSDGTVYLLGGSAAVPDKVQSRLEDLGITVERLYGKNRYDTNLAILEEAGVESGCEILVATAMNFADSLSASATGKPILLVDGKGSLSEKQKAFFEENGGGNITILGGEGAVSESIAAELSEYGEVERLAGESRYETSTLIADEYFDAVDTVVVAYGGNFPDGLSGGPVAYAMGAPLVLTASGAEQTAADYVDSNPVTNGYIMGGTAAITEQTVDIIFAQYVEATHTHSYRMVEEVAATCYGSGCKVFKCSCGDRYEETTPNLGGCVFEKTGHVEPTYTEMGYDELTCTRCGNINRHWIDKLVDPNATPEPTPEPTPKPEEPATPIWCTNCSKYTDHSGDKCPEPKVEWDNLCDICGRDLFGGNHYQWTIDMVCSCGKTIPAMQCHWH